jgi:hypothetical protein
MLFYGKKNILTIENKIAISGSGESSLGMTVYAVIR